MTVKKIIKKKITPIEKESKKLWYDSDCEEYYFDVNQQLITDNFDSTFNLEFNGKHIVGEISELPHCCGVYEIGDLGINPTFPQEAFNELMNGFLTKGYTLCVNTVSVSASNKTWASLLASCPLFTEVKSFVNPNSKNTIRMWISNN